MTASSPSQPDTAAAPTCCQAGRNRAYAAVLTGSTWARSAASERRRSTRSTPASHHWAPSVNSPRTSAPSEAIRVSASSATRSPSPNRAAASAVVNGPRVRAYRPSSSPSGSATASVNAAGTPTGTATPTASRSRPTSSIATHHVWPANATVSARLAVRKPSSQPSTSEAVERSAISAAVSGPSRRSRSATASASRARRSSERCCSWRSVAAITSGSSSSRSSTRPSSSASSAVSSDRTAARRSASGLSPSYMKAPT